MRGKYHFSHLWRLCFKNKCVFLRVFAFYMGSGDTFGSRSRQVWNRHIRMQYFQRRKYNKNGKLSVYFWQVRGRVRGIFWERNIDCDIPGPELPFSWPRVAFSWPFLGQLWATNITIYISQIKNPLNTNPSIPKTYSINDLGVFFYYPYVIRTWFNNYGCPAATTITTTNVEWYEHDDDAAYDETYASYIRNPC